MKGRDLLRSALRLTEERADCCAGANAEADADKRAIRAAAVFIVVLCLLVLAQGFYNRRVQDQEQR